MADPGRTARSWKIAARQRRCFIVLYLLAVGIATGLIAGVATTGLIGAAVAQQTSDRHNWARYVNVRFQYAICYPQDLLVPQGESANSDGQRFLSNKDNGQLVVYGTNNALDETLRQRLSDTGSRLAGSSGEVTYKVQKGNWFAVSGQSGETVFYAKTVFSHGQFKSFELTYDRSAAALYDSLVGRFVSCFTDLAR
jgi:hypothetical protein